MPAVFLGVRHHSPACARLVAATIERLRPSYVLVEGPCDLNGRLEELFLGHELPVAVFSHYRDAERAATSWTPLCDYSPEWVALLAGRSVGADVRFIDLPAWHPAFAERANRYADAEARYTEVTARLCARFGVDGVDALWDRLFEVADDEDLAERLDTYFASVRGDTRADDGDRAREEFMASWVRAALAVPGDPTVVVVTGGFHQPALRSLVGVTNAGGSGGGESGGAVGGAPRWPEVPGAAEGALTGSYLVPYSFRQLDSFAGYESGMPSPGYYQRVWDDGVEAAADGLVRAVVSRLRARNHPVSTADLIAARALTRGLTALRGHPRPARTDVLDGMAGALVGEDLDQPLPWTTRGTLAPGAHPVVVEMLAASGGDRVGALHPATPRPPLVADVAGRLTALGLTGEGPFTLDLTRPADLERSRVLHRLRVLGIPGYERTEGPRGGADPRFTERWEGHPAPARDAALIEAGAYGATLTEAAEARLTERARGTAPVPDDSLASADATTGTAPGTGSHGPSTGVPAPQAPGPPPPPPPGAVPGADGEVDAEALARTLFDAVLCGVERLSDALLGALAARVRGLRAAGPLGSVLATALGLWRHDRVFGTVRSPLLASVLDGAVERLLWLFEGARASRPPAPGTTGPTVDLARLAAVAAVRDALWHAPGALSVAPEAAASVAHRVSLDPAAPPDLRGAAFGLRRCLTGEHDPAAVGTAVRALPGAAVLGDWLAGLFAVTRDEMTAAGGSGGSGPESLIGVLDGMVGAMSDEEFLIGLPALRQAFVFFPPRERERIAERLMERRGVRGSARSLLRTSADPLLLARAAALEQQVTRRLDHYGLGTAR
ncbi:DUF5682 family protein [Streptomyces caniscabiei]|uniref:Uncharacterized protein n=1 Tax=Streptomyces caniscabiei TaxID=2746961 RepID=A0A927L8Z2_9ACTN|nr:DUF5682 family protein [Streptomyces caniscabiei]MBD9726249.1 hypothetical protein [Streptomyces caniscabiei]MDX3512418.1 DUF5682 family protein [Streptomyces caniscabiei]MDX3721775.1 DUF5682 family protein [Streptomyces caniscabiei]WEO28641.1 DUF5682 family protein [Streptomyces caniscabiei]